MRVPGPVRTKEPDFLLPFVQRLEGAALLIGGQDWAQCSQKAKRTTAGGMVHVVVLLHEYWKGLGESLAEAEGVRSEDYGTCGREQQRKRIVTMGR